MDTLDSIFKRRSVRRYKPDPVSDKDLEQVLEALRWAPSWANTQPWEIVVVRDDDVKLKLQETIPEGNPARKAMVKAPVIIVLCGKKGVSGVYKGNTVTALGDWMMFDVGIAGQNLCLAAHALGLGTVHAGYVDHEAASEVLGLPEDVTVVELIPLGHPDHDPSAPPRKELTEFVSYDEYGKR